jgi:hypothetical protein
VIAGARAWPAARCGASAVPFQIEDASVAPRHHQILAGPQRRRSWSTPRVIAGARGLAYNTLRGAGRAFPDRGCCFAGTAAPPSPGRPTPAAQLADGAHDRRRPGLAYSTPKREPMPASAPQLVEAVRGHRGSGHLAAGRGERVLRFRLAEV